VKVEVRILIRATIRGELENQRSSVAIGGSTGGTGEQSPPPKKKSKK